MRFCILFLMWLGAVVVYGQTDTTRQQPAALEQDESENLAVPDPDISKEDRVEVEISELPELLQNRLENDAQYAGWEEGTVYLEKNTNEYLLHISQENTTRTYRFDEFGNALHDTVPAAIPRKRVPK